jgi:hypothetical protein
MRPDPGLVIDERLRAIVLVEGRPISPPLDDEEMTGVIEGLGELVGHAAHLPSHPGLCGPHQLSDLLTARDLHVDVAESDDHVRLPWILATILQAYPGIDEHVPTGCKRPPRGSFGGANERLETAKVETLAPPSGRCLLAR